MPTQNMLARRALGAVALISALALGACSSAPTDEIAGDRHVAINVAPNALPGVLDVCYELTVTNSAGKVIWPPAYRQWAHNQGFAVHATVRAASGGGRFFESPAAGSPREVARAPARALEIATPPSGATYLIDPTLRREFQTLALRATTARLGRIEWQVNGKDVGSVPSDEPLMWPLVPGTHTITARDARGHSADARITVR